MQYMDGGAVEWRDEYCSPSRWWTRLVCRFFPHKVFRETNQTTIYCLRCWRVGEFWPRQSVDRAAGLAVAGKVGYWQGIRAGISILFFPALVMTAAFLPFALKGWIDAWLIAALVLLDVGMAVGYFYGVWVERNAWPDHEEDV